MTPPTTDTIREAVDFSHMSSGDMRGLLYKQADETTAMRAERDAALLREKSLKDNTEELRQLRREFNAVKAERDALRDQLAAARNETLEEAARVVDIEYEMHKDYRNASLLCNNDDAAQDRLARMTTCSVLSADIDALKSTTPAPRHSDDAAVDRFAEAMKAKLATKRADGRGGWDNKKVCSQALLSDLLRGHVDKGDPVDVANFSMMLHQRGEAIMSATREDCPECKGSGMRDSGGVQPWGEPIDVPCDCENTPREVTVQEAARVLHGAWLEGRFESSADEALQDMIDSGVNFDCHDAMENWFRAALEETK